MSGTGPTQVTAAAQGLITTQQERIPLYRNGTVVRWALQVITLFLVILGGLFFSTEALSNLEQRGIGFDFDFLETNQGFDIAFGIDANPDTGGRALWVGMVNTIRLAIASIVLATTLGVAVGVARLSDNWIASRLASIHVETFRNLPLLVQIFVALVIFQQFGRLTADTGPWDGWLYASAFGVSMPRVFIADGFYQWAIFVLVGAVLARQLFRARVARRESTGQDTRAGLVAFSALSAVALVGWFIHPVVGFLGTILQAVSDIWAATPQLAVELLLSGLALGASARWVIRFLESHRTPAGRAKLTDDGVFRIVFSVLGALLACVLFLVIWPGLSSWIVHSGSDFFQVAADKFGEDSLGKPRTGAPIGAARPSIEVDPNNPLILDYNTQALTLPIELLAILSALVLHSSAFVAEVVRGGILAVERGQTEAAAALGLSRRHSLRLIVLPQAARIILPPLGNQYLNLTKNTSLAIAALFTDAYVVGNTVINQSGRVVSVFLIWMAFYLTLSLLISIVVNFFNVRLAIVER